MAGATGDSTVVAIHTPALGANDSTATAAPGEAVAPSTHQLPRAEVESGLIAHDADFEHLNTDDRTRGDWRGRYPKEAHREIWFEARVVGGLLFITLASLLLVWRGSAFDFLAGDCTDCSRMSFDRYAYFYLGGQLGGILFGVKYLYKVVARGYWNLDRRLWRFFSPFLSGGLAVAVGALMDAGVLGLTTKASTGSSFFALGFVAGYFADSALAKMQEIAETIFGPPGRSKPPQSTKAE